MQWQRNAEFILKQTADVMVGTLSYLSRIVLCANELCKDLRLFWRRTPSAASAIANSRGAPREMQIHDEADVGYRFTYIRGRHAWANFRVHVALLVCDRRAAMDRLACLCAQWMSIDRGMTGVEVGDWRARLKLFASLVVGCQCSLAPRRRPSHPPPLSLSSRPKPSLRAPVRQRPRLRITFLEGWPRSSQRPKCSARAERMSMEDPPCTIYSGVRVPGDDEAVGEDRKITVDFGRNAQSSTRAHTRRQSQATSKVT